MSFRPMSVMAVLLRPRAALLGYALRRKSEALRLIPFATPLAAWSATWVFSELTIAAVLGHAARGVTQGYVHIDEALKLAATPTCEEIASLLRPELDANALAREEAA
jgi:hypothetical protein